MFKIPFFVDSEIEALLPPPAAAPPQPGAQPVRFSRPCVCNGGGNGRRQASVAVWARFETFAIPLDSGRTVLHPCQGEDREYFIGECAVRWFLIYFIVVAWLLRLLREVLFCPRDSVSQMNTLESPASTAYFFI